ncbi:hypothetical protein Q1J52_18480 [Pseudomonas lijiangensis]|uniref:hypothetical protein n=1 Tax=Pseudomonas lijiangensis TaxID=2995658 RepID=UPI0034D69CC0
MRGSVSALFTLTLGSLALSGCVPIAPPAQGFNAMSAQPVSQPTSMLEARKAHDEMFARFKTSGKAILVVPSASLDSLKTDFGNNDDIARFLRLRSGVTEWTNTSRPSSSIKVGYDTSNKPDENNGENSYFQLVFGRTLYKIYLVDPGHYSISGVSYNLPRTAAFEAPGGRNIQPSSLGYAMLKSITFDEFERGKKWEDASYRNETVQEDYCTSVRVVNNECTSWGKNSYDVKRQTSPAGWTESIKQRTIEARSVTAKINKEFASFDIASGEVILIDGFFAEPPAAELRENSCKQADQEQMRCELKQLTLVQLLGEVEEVRKSQNPADWGLPKMAEVLKGLTYRPITIKARETSGKSVWGPSYSVKAN